MTRVLDLTLLDDSPESFREWMNDDRPYGAFRVPPGRLLTPDQFDEWLCLCDAEDDVDAADSYALRVGRAD